MSYTVDFLLHEARSRIRLYPALWALRKVILADRNCTDEHLRWVLTADLVDIEEWALDRR